MKRNPRPQKSTESYFNGIGGLRREGAVWREYPALADGDHFEFKELRRDPNHIYLFDLTRKRDIRSPMYLRVPIDGGIVQWGYPNPLVWQDLYVVEPGPIPRI